MSKVVNNIIFVAGFIGVFLLWLLWNMLLVISLISIFKNLAGLDIEYTLTNIVGAYLLLMMFGNKWVTDPIEAWKRNFIK